MFAHLKVSLGNGIVNRLAAEPIAERWRNTVKESLRDGSLAKTLEEFGYDLVKRPKDNAITGWINLQTDGSR
jgi:hypothetical protein